MTDGREELPVGTRLELEQGSVYEITGEPIGCGGSGILYPARRVILPYGVTQADGFCYALKECYPVSVGRRFIRNGNGEIIPQDGNPEDARYLFRAQQLQLEESRISQKIYLTASRVLPIRESSQSVLLTLPGKAAVSAANTVTVMDSLSEKGRSLTVWLKERRRFSPGETFRIIQHLLFALREVHQAGFLHLDIQDGNVFLRGTLEDKSELLTLIDFGSARPMTDGKTAPIADRVIFTSEGYSAPEMLLHNDGTLQLGVEADLYSVGCLALYLLTGHKADAKLLLANQTGRYLKPNQIRRMQCPGHLVERMQEILARALEQQPEKRYHSADEMLADVTDLANALQPYRTDLNAVRYDAFICYKHNPIDCAAAVTLQQALEHFRAPRGMAWKRGTPRRVFVDEGELSSCADFGQQIREALKNAGWLIVICSPDTPISPWVQLEIDTFLEYHDRSRILAVLTAGDPDTSFPLQLKPDGAGTGEVLAADARGGSIRQVRKKLHGDALLKIAAPMLGTTFDTLKQRQKVYLMQRVTAVAAGFLLSALSFAAYAVNRANVIAQQAERIAMEYEHSLLNESRFLTEQAEKRLNANDPLGAIELSLAALPSETQDRPILTEAEYILGKALGIYTTPGSVYGTVTAVGKIETQDSHFCLDDTGGYLFSWNKYGLSDSIRIWDAKKLTQIGELFSDEFVSVIPIGTNGSNLYVKLYGQVCSIDCRTGQENWRVELDGILTACLSQDKTRLAVLSADAQSNALALDILSVDSGEKLRHVPFSVRKKQCSAYSICVSPDLRWAAVSAVDEEQSTVMIPHCFLCLVDLETGICDLLLDEATAIQAVAFVENRLCWLRSYGYTFTTQEGKTQVEYITPVTNQMEAYDPGSQRLLWSQEQRLYPKTSGIVAMKATQYDTGSAAGKGILYTFGNRCVLLDWKNGEIVREYELSSGIMDIQYTDNGFETINADGWYSSADYDIDYMMDTVVNRQLWLDTITMACRNEDTFYVQSSPGFTNDFTIRVYKLDKFDDAYVPVWRSGESDWRVHSLRATPAGVRILLARDDQVCLIDTDGTSRIHDVPEQFSFSAYSATPGISKDGARLYLTCSNEESHSFWLDGYTFARIDLLTGKIEKLSPPVAPTDHWYVYDSNKLFFDEKLLFTATRTEWEGPDKGRGQLCVFSWDFRENELAELYRCVVQDGSRFRSLSVDETRCLCFSIGEDWPSRLVRINLDTGEAVSVPVGVPLENGERNDFAAGCIWNRSGSLAVFDWESTVYVLDRDGKQLCSIPLDENPSGIRFAPDEQSLLIYAADNTITRYSIPDGAKLESISLNDYRTLYHLSMTGAQDLAWEYIDETTLAVYSTYECFLLDISGDSIRTKATVDHCFGFDASANRFLVADMDHAEKEIGSIPRYTLEELIRKGNTALGRGVQP